MVKTKAFSIISAAAVAVSMAAVGSMSASAATNPLGLQMTSAKTSYTLDEVKAGAVAKVYVDAVGTVSEADSVKSLEFALVPDTWGKVDPINLKLSDKNVLATKKGDSPERECFNNMASIVSSSWTTAAPSDPGYTVINYNQVSGFTGYQVDVCPKVIIMSDSDKGFLKTTGTGSHIAEFDVAFPSNLAAGTYTINFSGAKSIICPNGDPLSNDAVLVNAPTAKGITFTIGAGGSTPGGDNPGGNTPGGDTPSEGVLGDANLDGKLNVRDAAFIASKLAQGKADDLPKLADYNQDGKINVRDAAAIAKFLASGK